MCNARTIPLYTTELFGLLIECGLYGTMIPLVMRTLTKLEKRRMDGRSRNSRIFQGITCCMVVFATWHLAVECYRIVYTSLHFQTLEEKTEWLGDGRGITQNLKDFGYVFQTLTGDGILVYRCYLIWANNKWVAALPTFTYLISWGLGLAGLGREIQKIDANVYTGKLEKIILGFFLCSAITVLTSTSAILLRIWLIRRHLNSILFAPSLAIFLESGAIYSTFVIVLAALFIAQCSPQIVFLDILNPLIPILFCAIILTLSEGKVDVETSRSSQSRSRSRTAAHSITHMFRHRTDKSGNSTYPSSMPVDSVHVHQEVELSPMGRNSRPDYDGTVKKPEPLDIARRPWDEV